MHFTADSIFVLLLGVSSLAFSAPIAKHSWELNQRTGSQITEEAFLRLFQVAGVVFIFGAILTFFGILPLR